MNPTRPATAADDRPIALLGIEIPPCPALPRGGLFLAGVPRSACSPSPKLVIETTCEPVSEVA